MKANLFMRAFMELERAKPQKDQILAIINERGRIDYTSGAELARTLGMTNKWNTLERWLQKFDDNGLIIWDKNRKFVSDLKIIEAEATPVPVVNNALPVPVIKSKFTTIHDYVARILVIIGATFLILAQIGVDVVAPYMGGKYQVWASYINDAVPALRNLGTIIAMLGLPSIAKLSWMHAFVAWSLYLGGIWWSWTNNYSWTDTIMTDSSYARTDQRREQLEQQFDLAVKRKRLAEAQVEASKALKERDRLCSINDGTSCLLATRKTVPAVLKRESNANEDLQNAEKEIKEALKKGEDSRPTYVINQNKIINAILPLLGGILVRLVSI